MIQLLQASGEMMYPRAAYVNPTNLQPSTRRELSLVGTAAEHKKEKAQVVPLLISANVMVREDWQEVGGELF